MKDTKIALVPLIGFHRRRPFLRWRHSRCLGQGSRNRRLRGSNRTVPLLLLLDVARLLLLRRLLCEIRVVVLLHVRGYGDVDWRDVCLAQMRRVEVGLLLGNRRACR